MKNIELTEDHKSKLLEMCKELFPEYCWKNSFEFGDNILVYCTSEGCESIHWFEFCTITLWNELYLKLGNLELKSYYELLLNDLINPVDYLYEEFKKLK